MKKRTQRVGNHKSAEKGKVNDRRWKTCEVHSPRERDTEPEKKKRGQETQGGDHLGGLRAGTKQFFEDR